ncbi:MAG: hypothetical protein HYY90_04960 [Candidatus Omnitrophica bacterium]|nr:hypothetical protein [Candidatus Omnitrophota bacterium]
MAVMIAITTAIGAYALLVASLNQARQSTGNAARMRARYAAEAGLVWAQQQLLANESTFCGGNHGVGGLTVSVTVTNCGAGNTHTLSATVSY